ncbi:hypothetical protein F53441_4922 [Fusarium austroafricanum]|uniref:Uncharacterized protein n=1 Tax=Fusarium austroafricanum TaxID=2364996 RepID=A0A8H4KM36_9HYPO|nr:hypothetical protein F53441_4922 [Fusarium austroafricanum]
MQSVFTIALLLGSTLAVPLNAGQDYAIPNDLGHYAQKRQAVPQGLPVDPVAELINSLIAEALTAEYTATETTALPDATSTTALVIPTEDPSVPFGSGNEKRQSGSDPVAGLLGGVLGGLKERQLDGVKTLVSTLNAVQVNKRQLESVTGLLAGLKPEELSKRQADAVTGLLGGVLGGVKERDLEALKPEHLSKRQLGTVTGLIGLKPEQMSKRQVEAVTGLLGPILGGLPGLGAPPVVPTDLPAATGTTTAEPTTTTYAIPTATNLESMPTFGPE